MDLSTLQSRASSAYIPPHRTQLHPRMYSTPSLKQSSSSSSSSLSSLSSLSQHSRDKWLIMAAFVLTIPFLFYIFSLAQGLHRSSKFTNPNPNPTLFGLVLHASPSAARIRVFHSLNDAPIPFIASNLNSNSLKLRPGLPDDPQAAGISILGLIQFAKQRVPRSAWSSTKVQLELEDLGAESAQAALESCRKVLRSSGFLFRDEWARVLKGQEGVYAWVAVNYALGSLGGEPQETTGIVELGGTSMQIAFAPREPPPVQFLRVIKLAGVTYNLHTQSLTQFGQNAVWESLTELLNSRGLTSSSNSREVIVSNPCIPKGYGLTPDASSAKILTSRPAGNFSSCRLEALALLKRRKDKCLQPPCEIVSSLLVESQGKLVPPENFFYTSELFGLVPKASLSELEAAGQHYCEGDWNTLKTQHSEVDDLDLLRYCFSSAYIVALLHDDLGIPMNDKRIGYGNKTEGIPLDWMLGAFILQTMLEPLGLETDSLVQIVGNESVTYFSLFALLLIAVLAAFFVLKWRKPQLKTIYDLEKGRYIVTRVPR